MQNANLVTLIPAVKKIMLSAVCILFIGLSSCTNAPTTTTPDVSIPANEQPDSPAFPVTGTTTTGSAVTWTPDGIISPGEYQKNHSYGDYNLYWSADAQYIYIGMKAKTTGWVAVGFDPENMMKNADIVEGFVSGSKLTIHDMFSTGEFGPHPPDIELGGTDDILQSGGSEADGFTTIEFKRKLVTGDKYDKPLVKGINKIMWSFAGDDQLFQKHLSRGYGELDL